jgi:hypothetical protein
LAAIRRTSSRVSRLAAARRVTHPGFGANPALIQRLNAAVYISTGRQMSPGSPYALTRLCGYYRLRTLIRVLQRCDESNGITAGAINKAHGD